MKKSFLYITWAFLICLFLIVLVPMAFAEEGCDSSTNSNCIETNSNTNSTNNSNINSTTTVKSPPPSAITPSISSSSSDTCHIPAGGSIQTQILGISGGTTIRDLNCERLKNAARMFDMGLKISAVAIMCQDKRIWESMKDAGTFCPINGKVGYDRDWETSSSL